MVEKNYLWRIYWRLAGVIMVCVVIALAAVSYFSHRVFDRELVPETEQKAATVGASVRALVLKATSYGIDFSQLYGVEQTFAEVFEENPEFAYMAITNTDGNVLFARGTEPIGARTHFRNPVVLQIAHETGELSKAARVGQQYIVSMPINDAGKPLGVLHVGIDTMYCWPTRAALDISPCSWAICSTTGLRKCERAPMGSVPRAKSTLPSVLVIAM